MFTVHHVTAAPTTRRAQDSYAVAPVGFDVNAVDVHAHPDVIGRAHKTGAMWAVNTPSRFVGLAPTREIAIATLERIAELATAKVA